MKKIFLTCVVAMSLFAVDAQTKKSKKVKNSYARKEAKATAAFNKAQMEKQQMWEQDRIDRIKSDSERLDRDRVADAQFEQQRVDWKTKRLNEIDSSNSVNWKSMSVEQEKMLRVERERDAIVKNAKLKDNVGRQVKYINSTYSVKATDVKNNMSLTDAQKAEQFATLNNERRAKIKAIAGNGKERKLEKERKEYLKDHPDAVNELSWVDGIVKNK
ncbi:MAG: hypothetical protein ABIY51_02720 [Ferruginibacter sp.]